MEEGASRRTVLVTGATGFVGRHVCAYLHAAGLRVRAAVRAAADLPATWEQVIVGEIGPDTVWDTALDGTEAVVHLASHSPRAGASPEDTAAAYRRVNVAGTECLARAAAAAGVRRMVYMSTIKVNGEFTADSNHSPESGTGKNAPHPNPLPGGEGIKTGLLPGEEGIKKGFPPAREGMKCGNMSFTEDDEPHPQDVYGHSKWEAERLLRTLAAHSGLEVVILRPPLVYGPKVKGNFLSLLRLVERGIPVPLGLVRNRRSMLYVGNLADAVLRCLDTPQAPGQTYLLSDGADLSTPELLERIAFHLGCTARVWPLPVALLRGVGALLGQSAAVARLTGSLLVDSGKIRAELGWTPPFSLDDGLRETARGYLAERKK